MNFFEQQARARRSSARLVLLFALAVAAIVAAVDAIVFLFLPHPGVLLLVSVITLLVIGGGSAWRISSLGGGGRVVAEQMGGTEVPSNTQDPSLRRLRNVVEEIAIASSLPMPRLYVLEDEAGINAFAAGFAPTDAAVAVTRGALDRLNRDELQGVIAHEFSHILNGDMRLNLRMIGVLFGILMVGLIARKVLEYGRFRGSGALLVLLVTLTLMLVGYIGLLFGRMIKAGISRSRERLADATAVQFTRQTAGLAGALKKIAGVAEGSRLDQRSKAEEVSHMLFGDGLGFSRLFATHPPLLERIRVLDPSFSARALDALKARWVLTPPDGLSEDVQLGLVGEGELPPLRAGVMLPPLPTAAGRAGPRPPPLPGAATQIRLAGTEVAAQVATPDADDYLRAGAIIAALPEVLRALARDREAVIALLLALLLDADATVRERQLAEVGPRLGAAIVEQAVELRDQHLQSLHPMLRLPLAALAFPALRLRPRPQLDAFLTAVQAVANADGGVSLFEYCLGKLLTVQVREALDPARYVQFGRRKPGGVRQEFATLLAVVAQYGNADEAAARRAYLAGMQRVLPRDVLPYAPPANGVAALESVWEPLDALDPLAKQVMVEAVTEAIGSDGRINVAEAELLRTICGVLHCPLPPMLEQAS